MRHTRDHEYIEVENQAGAFQSLIDKVRDYAETRIDLIKYKAIDKSSSIIALIVSIIAMIVFVLMFIIFLNIGLALLIGDWLGNAYYGFFIVAGFYAITGIVLFIFRNKWLKVPVTNMMIKSLLD